MGILQTRILEWVAMLSSRGSSQPRDRTQVSHNAGHSCNHLSHEIEGRNINNLRYEGDTTLMEESKEELNSLLKVRMKKLVKAQHSKKWRSWHQIPWQIDGETMEIVRDFIFLGPKITVDSDYSHEIKRWLLLGRKAMTKLDSILKSRDITLLTKICIVKAMIFPVVM